MRGLVCACTASWWLENAVWWQSLDVAKRLERGFEADSSSWGGTNCHPERGRTPRPCPSSACLTCSGGRRDDHQLPCVILTSAHKSNLPFPTPRYEAVLCCPGKWSCERPHYSTQPPQRCTPALAGVSASFTALATTFEAPLRPPAPPACPCPPPPPRHPGTEGSGGWAEPPCAVRRSVGFARPTECAGNSVLAAATVGDDCWRRPRRHQWHVEAAG